jgi:hypothetical protein
MGLYKIETGLPPSESNRFPSSSPLIVKVGGFLLIQSPRPSPAPHQQSQPVFKKLAETKKSTPSDLVGFRKNRPNSVKTDRNSFD